MELVNNEVNLDGNDQAALGLELNWVPAADIANHWLSAIAQTVARQRDLEGCPLPPPVVVAGPGFCFVGTSVAQHELNRLKLREEHLRKIGHAAQAISFETLP